MGDGVKAFETLRYARFDVLLIDLMMPEMDGVTLTQKVQDEFEIAPLILMMTAVGDDDLYQQTLQAGAYEFLIKPYLLCRKQPSSIVNDCHSFGIIGEAITYQVTLTNKKLWNRKKQE